MIAWMMLAQAALLGLLGAGVTVAGIAKVRMNDWILGAAAIATLTLVVQIVASIIAPSQAPALQATRSSTGCTSSWLC